MRFLPLLALFLGALPAAAAEPVDTALVVAVDVSLSVDDARYRLQRDGTAAAFESREVIDAIATGPNGAIEVAVLEFSDSDRQIDVIPWTRISRPEEARAFAARLRGVHRSSRGLTGIADALLAADALFDELPEPATRRIVDVSSDGMNNTGTEIAAARDRVLADGITINGLPILTEEKWLDTYYAEYVIGGEDSFLQVARDPASFGEAMRKKLERELVVARLDPGNLRRITTIR
jgi:hypothetical protein